MVLRTTTPERAAGAAEAARAAEGPGPVAGARTRSDPASSTKRFFADRKRQARLVSLGAWALGLTPLALLAARFLDRGLGANPIEALILHFGIWALILLLVTLAVTPVRRISGFNPLIRARRPLGLFAFFYLTLHFLSYLVLDQFFAWEYIVEDVIERPFITLGFLAFLLLIPLAVTSTKGWIRRLGKKWTLLHKLVYVATALGAIHYYWNVRADEPDPLVAFAVLGLLLALRLPPIAKRIARR